MQLARRVVFFILTNILVVATITIIMGVLGIQNYRGANLDLGSLAIYCLIWGFAGSIISLLISKRMAIWSMGVEIIDPRNPGGRGEAELLQMVYRLSQAAGLKKMPTVGIYRSHEVNAFATGATKNNSLVAVSTGLLARMDRNAVEGVVGHEVAHIANGDMVTMTLLQGIVNAFVMFIARVLAFAISNAGRREGEDSRGSNFFLVMILEIVLGFFGMMIVAWFSRWREYRADAGSARIGGKEKMIAALQSLRNTSNLIDDSQEALAAFKISGNRRGSLMALFSTHPPLEDRIERLRNLSVR